MFAIDIQDEILNKLNTLVVVLNNDGSLDYASKSAKQMLGYESQDLLGKNWFNTAHFSKPEGEQIKNRIINIFNDKRISTQTFEQELKTSGGGRKWIRWDISYLNDNQLIAAGFDITSNKINERRLTEYNKQLLEKNKNVTDSIYYAQRIQQSILQSPEELNNYFKNSFLLYKPKDIVSGDYYWFYEDDFYAYLAVVDCTGHGVPGAMMSMVANSMFKEVFINRKISNPSEILKALDEELAKTINKNLDTTFNDGMDVSLIRIDKKNNDLSFSGALRSILIARDSEIIELKGSRYPIGFYSGIEKKFETQLFQLQKNDTIYLFTDGFIDQFGGERNKKLNKSNFKDLILTINDMEMDEQEAFLDYSLNNWKQDNEQTDDVLVVGIKI